MGRIVRENITAVKLAAIAVVCIIFQAILLGSPNFPGLEPGEEVGDPRPPHNGEGTIIPGPICQGATDECPSHDQIEDYRTILDDPTFQSILQRLDSDTFQKRQKAQADLMAYLSSLSGEGLLKTLTLLRCLGTSHSREVRERARVAVENFTGVKPICEQPPGTLEIELIPVMPPAVSCHSHSEEIESPGGASCADANIALKVQIQRRVQEIEEQVGSCSQYVVPMQETENFLNNGAWPLACCVDKERCQFVTPKVLAAYELLYKSKADQEACFREKCARFGGVFSAECEPEEESHGAKFRYGNPDTCSESDEYACCDELPSPTPAESPTLAPPEDEGTPTPDPSLDMSPEPSPEPSPNDSPAPTESPEPGPSQGNLLSGSPKANPSWVPS